MDSCAKAGNGVVDMLRGSRMILAMLLLFLTGASILLLYHLPYFNDQVTSPSMIPPYHMYGMVIKSDHHSIILQDCELMLHHFYIRQANTEIQIGDVVSFQYVNYEANDDVYPECEYEVVNYDIVHPFEDAYQIPPDWRDHGIFSNSYTDAYQKLKAMSLAEKIGQLLLVRYPDANQTEILSDYHLGGYLFFAKDFANKNAAEVQAMIASVQAESDIPLLIAVDEEGGSVVRISSNPLLRSERFQSPGELFQIGGFEQIMFDAVEKNRLLANLGINLNLAPVVDVAAEETDYMYERTLKQNSDLTAQYAELVIKASKGSGVSYTLKHFPGYGSNADTHIGSSMDHRSFASIKEKDLPPFEAGIQSGAESVLVSHNVVTSMDDENPASLSPLIHDYLRKQLSFTGVIITDDIAMGALGDVNDTSIKAVLAGNDLIITTDYEDSFQSIYTAVKQGVIDEGMIDKAVFRILAWKYEKGLLSKTSELENVLSK